jgi:hypothetical protein
MGTVNVTSAEQQCVFVLHFIYVIYCGTGISSTYNKQIYFVQNLSNDFWCCV